MFSLCKRLLWLWAAATENQALTPSPAMIQPRKSCAVGPGRSSPLPNATTSANLPTGMLSECAFRSCSRGSKETRGFVSSSLLHQHVWDVQTLRYAYFSHPFSINPAEQEERPWLYILRSVGFIIADTASPNCKK